MTNQEIKDSLDQAEDLLFDVAQELKRRGFDQHDARYLSRKVGEYRNALMVGFDRETVDATR